MASKILHRLFTFMKADVIRALIEQSTAFVTTEIIQHTLSMYQRRKRVFRMKDIGEVSVRLV